MEICRTLQITLEEVQDSIHKLLDMLNSTVPSKVVLPTSEAVLEPAQSMWHNCALTLKKAEKEYFVPSKWTEYLFSHHNLNSLVFQVVMDKTGSTSLGLLC